MIHVKGDSQLLEKCFFFVFSNISENYRNRTVCKGEKHFKMNLCTCFFESLLGCPFESSHSKIQKTLSEDCAVRNSHLARVTFAGQADKD